ncbi:hypothetical protein ACIBG7_34420 [Nonomuraea sp. NPDC050328]|uniref:hypothetical protein n=1 Tax=Nonomuraea sp. NPDC050328 TaxID=3364361 RepID=UPI0037BB26D3
MPPRRVRLGSVAVPPGGLELLAGTVLHERPPAVPDADVEVLALTERRWGLLEAGREPPSGRLLLRRR